MSLTKATFSMINGAFANVLDFGAYNDGTNATATTAAIQAALNSLAATGGTVYFPVGNYAVNATLTCPDIDPGTPYASPIRLLGDTVYETTHGTRIKWMGGNSTILYRLPSYGVIENIFFYNGNAATGVTCIDAVSSGTSENSPRTYCTNVVIKNFYKGFQYNYAWYHTFINCNVISCYYGFLFQTECNGIALFGCTIASCTRGISDRGGTGSTGVVWTGGAIEGCTEYGIDFSDLGSESNGWVFDGVYFEANTKTAALAKHITLRNCTINGDSLPGGEPIEIYSSRGVRIESLYLRNSAYTTVGVIKIFGTASNYVKNSVYLDVPYYREALELSVRDYRSMLIDEGILAFTCYKVIETPYIDASFAYADAVAVVGDPINNELKVVAAKIIVDTQVVVSGSFTVGAGFNPNFNQLAAYTFNANVPVGIYDMSAATPVAINTTSTTWRWYGTAETSGKYKMRLYLI